MVFLCLILINYFWFKLNTIKKLIYLFLALLIVACSSDDSSNDSDPTFLEEYNNTVFECQNCPSESDYSSPIYIGFTPSDNFLYYNYENLSGCYYIFEGNLNGLNDDFGIVAITNNTIDNLTYSKTYSDGVEIYNFNTSGTSLNLIINWPDGETDSFLYIVTNLTVNDICN